jgi:hypothetical protein
MTIEPARSFAEDCEEGDWQSGGQGDTTAVLELLKSAVRLMR